MTLCAEVVHLVWICFANDFGQTNSVGQIAIVQFQARAVFVRVLIDVIETLRVETGTAANDSMNFIALRKQKFGKITAVLSCDSSDDCLLHCARLIICRIDQSARLSLIYLRRV